MPSDPIYVEVTLDRESVQDAYTETVAHARMSVGVHAALRAGSVSEAELMLADAAERLPPRTGPLEFDPGDGFDAKMAGWAKAGRDFDHALALVRERRALEEAAEHAPL